ncbi:unnamed protein product, partial [Adineta steineri]
IKLLFLSPLQSAQAEQYARVAGLFLIGIGNYYSVAGKNTLIPFFSVNISLVQILFNSKCSSSVPY